MNEQQFDKLFRSKLADHTRIPSETALDKLDKALNQHNRGIWVPVGKVAATLLLIAVSTFMVSKWRYHEGNTLPVVSNQELITPVVIDPSSKADTASVNTRKKLTITSSKLAQAPAKSAAAVTKRKHEPETNQEFQQSQVEAPHQVTKEMVSDVAVEPEENLQAATEINEPSRPRVTITYKRSTSIPEPNLALQQQDQEAPKVEKGSGLKGLWRKAARVDYQNISLAGIRATKDELLAINKRSKNKDNKPD
ncbi:MAG: hypothetical protein DHS20C17_05980 [Cyclobacteriaceae bacterium]|nr:MAG: hypothetical protein DHS20C17_05980 [Cyclobacteriaceae bacterium]